mgnify:FL=1
MSAFQFFKPKPGAFGRSFTVESVSVGTGGTSVANTATTSVILPTPGRKCQLVGLNINALVAAASTGTVTAQVFKRNNVPASPADVTLTATKSLKSDVVTTLQKSYAMAITGADADCIIQASDMLRVDVVASNTITTQPTVSITAVYAVME